MLIAKKLKNLLNFSRRLEFFLLLFRLVNEVWRRLDFIANKDAMTFTVKNEDKYLD